MRSETQVMLVPEESTDRLRETVERLLRGVKFAAPTLYSLDDLFSDLRIGRKQLWIFYEDEPEEAFLFGIMRVADFPQGKMAVIGPIAGRRFKAMFDFYPRFELWMQMQGIACIHAEVGEKLRRVLNKRGFVATGFAMYKSLRTMN